MRKNRIKMITLLVLTASVSSVLFFSKSELQNAKKLLKDDLQSYAEWSVNVPFQNGAFIINESVTTSLQGPGQITKISCPASSGGSIAIANFSCTQKGSEYEIKGSAKFPIVNAVGAEINGSFQFTVAKSLAKSQSFTIPAYVPACSQVDRMDCYYWHPIECHPQNDNQACNTYYFNELANAVNNLD